jgi:prepilin-type processing-associated H-X9-DG protein
VVIAIIGALIALLLPAVQSAREAARRVQCLNNFKQIGIALHNYHDAFGSFPIGRMGIGYSYSNTPWWNDQRKSWTFSILPFFEQTSAFAAINFDLPFYYRDNTTVIRLQNNSFQCPSDGPSIQEPDTAYPRGKGNFAANWGNTHYFQDEPDRGSGQGTPGGDPYVRGPMGTVKFTGAPFKGNISTSLSNILDGTNNTILVGEVILGKNAPGGLWDHRGDVFNDDYNCSSFMTYTPPNSPIPDQMGGDDPTGFPWCAQGYMNNPPCNGSIPAFNASRSRHPGGVNTLFGDGSVRFVRNAISLDVWRALGSPAAGEVVSGDAY